MVDVDADAVQDLVVRDCSVGDSVCEPQQSFLTGSTATPPMVVAEYSISAMSQYTNTQLSVQLQDATEDGMFDTNLHTLAASNDAQALLNVTSGAVDFSYPSTDDNSGGDGRLSPGAMAGIVIAAVVGAVLVGAVFYLAYTKWFQRKCRSDDPKFLLFDVLSFFISTIHVVFIAGKTPMAAAAADVQLSGAA